jgi:hypothetical protein
MRLFLSVRPRRRFLALGFFLASLPLAAACGGSPLGPSESAQSTFLTFSSQKGDYIGQGESHRYTLADGVWSASYLPNYGGRPAITLGIRPKDGVYNWWWNLSLAAPLGRQLAVGTYETARRWPFEPPDQPGLDFSGSGRGCNTSTGRFVITELALGPDNSVDSLHATFEQHCEGVSVALTGEVAIVANPWR